MLERLILTDFQAHATLDVELAPITCFVGRTDAGKSAALRALRWAALNEGRVAGLIRHGATGASAMLCVDGQAVRRCRDAEGNRYEYGGEVYAALGAEGNVPERIATLLNVGPVNFQGQFDGPYWLAATAGEVSRALNAIVDLSVIDTSLAAAATAAQDARREEERARNRQAAAKEAYDALAWVDAAQAAYDALAESNAAAERIAARRDALWRGTDGLKKHTATAAAKRQKAAATLAVAVAGRDAARLAARRAALAGHCAALRRAAAVRAPDAAAVAGLVAAAQAVRTVRARRAAAAGVLQTARAAFAKSTAAFEASFSADLDYLTAADVCPLCGGTWQV